MAISEVTKVTINNLRNTLIQQREALVAQIDEREALNEADMESIINLDAQLEALDTDIPAPVAILEPKEL